MAGLGASDEVSNRHDWLTPERLAYLRGVLLGLTLFFGLVVWIFHTLGPATVRAPNFIFKLRGVGVLTWLYALVQMVDMRFYNSRFARRRRAQLRIPESLKGRVFEAISRYETLGQAILNLTPPAVRATTLGERRVATDL